jgi:hypothetical protein
MRIEYNDYAIYIIYDYSKKSFIVRIACNAGDFTSIKITDTDLFTDYKKLYKAGFYNDYYDFELEFLHNYITIYKGTDFIFKLELTDDEIHLIDNFLENMENWND